MQKISMPTCYGGIPDCINDLLSFVGSQFTPGMLTKLSDPTLGTFFYLFAFFIYIFICLVLIYFCVDEAGVKSVVVAILSATFEEQSGWHTSGSPLPEFFNLKITSSQADVLQALVEYVFYLCIPLLSSNSNILVSCDALWDLPEEELERIMEELHKLLKIGHAPSRETLRKSIENFRENPPVVEAANEEDQEMD
jgi:hypothetical protein